MVYQRIPKPSSGKAQKKESPFAPRRFEVQTKQGPPGPPAQEGAEDLWAEKLERASQLGHNLTAAPVQSSGPQAPTPSMDQPPVVQRFIKGKGGKQGVYRLLEKNEEWEKFFNSKGKKSEKYREELEKLLEELHKWESGFEASDIADAILANDHDSAGLERAKSSIVGGIEDYIDEEVLSGGHSGEKHYGKSQKYQEARRKKEKKEKQDKLTTIEDSAKTKKFFTQVKLNVRSDLLSQLSDMIDDVSKEINVGQVTRAVVKPITDPYVGDEKDFEESGYKITLDAISVQNVGGGGGVTLTIRPKLESAESYPKTEYTGEGGTQVVAPIVMYWGGNSPSITVVAGDDYNSLLGKLKEAIISPVTAF